ncbi:hypothetical protein NMG60_11025353 [Bertholletia excelsa]
MSGMLPGVELARRRRSCHRVYDEAHSNRHGGALGGSSFRPLVDADADDSGMDENALRARRRLGEKLGYLYPSRSDRERMNLGQEKKKTREGHKRLVPRILLGRPWQVRSKGQLCAVCLEDIRPESAAEEVTELPCSHRYHSDCLQSWIATGHPSCPSCRSPVQS